VLEQRRPIAALHDEQLLMKSSREGHVHVELKYPCTSAAVFEPVLIISLPLISSQ